MRGTRLFHVPVGIGPLAARYLSTPRKRLINRKLLRDFLSHPDDNLAFCTSSFDVSDSLIRRFEWKNAIHNWPNSPRIDEATDLA